MMNQDQESAQQKSALFAARRTMGFTQMGVHPSDITLKNVLRQLERTVAADQLPSTREIFNEIIATRVLPTQKRAHAAANEIKLEIQRMKSNLVAAPREDADEADGEEPDAPRGQ